MISFLKKIFTGYRVEKKKINGIDAIFSYSDKPIFFDPYSMLKEFKHRSSDSLVQRLILKVPFSEQLPDLTHPTEADRPNVICRCLNKGKEFKVSRFSLKSGIYPVSFYRFEFDGNLFGTLRRKYDHGSQVKKIAFDLATQNASEIDANKDSWLWENQNGAKTFLEKYGHTQVWSFSNTDFFV